jgi:4-carboxymuconolactone decarboxylase
MPRIPLLNDPATLNPEQRKIYDDVVAGPRGVLQGPIMAALHSPELATRWNKIGEFVRYKTSLPPHLSEVAILVTARAWSAQLEFYLHAPIARAAGVSDEVIEAIRLGRKPASSDRELMQVYEYARQLQADKTVSDAAHADIVARWGVVGVVELTAIIGYYSMVAMMLNANEFPLPDGATPPLPPLDAHANA